MVLRLQTQKTRKNAKKCKKIKISDFFQKITPKPASPPYHAYKSPAGNKPNTC